MNSKEFTISDYREHMSCETSPASNDEMVIDVIRLRMEHIATSSSKAPHYPRKPQRHPPAILHQHGADVLFQTQDLWLPVDGYFFISDRVIKALYVHKSNIPQTQRNMSVFWAMRKDVVKKRWDISPIAATQKQRFQFWDYDFVTAMIASIQADDASPSMLHNKISYQMSDSVTAEQLMIVRQQAHAQFATMIMHSSSKVYESVRNRFVGLPNTED